VSIESHHRFDGPEDAPVLLLSNSLGTSMAMWDGLVPAFSERFRVLRYDQRGHGSSPAPSGPYSIADLGGDTLELLDGLGIERVSVCGVSLGGMTGMWLAIHAPDRIDRLALCCTSAHMPLPGTLEERASTVRAEGMEPVVEASMERWLTPHAPPEISARLREMLLGTDPEGYAGCCEAIAALDLRAPIQSIRASTLVIATKDDPSIPPDHARLLGEAIPDARLVVLPEGRHLIAMEFPGQVASMVLDHLLAEASA
jgi:3-oxoadipate enol-lactonase